MGPLSPSLLDVPCLISGLVPAYHDAYLMFAAKSAFSNLDSLENFVFRQPLGIALLGVATAAFNFLLVLCTALFLDIYHYDCGSDSGIEWERFIPVVIVGPLIESLILGVVVWPFAKGSRVIIPVTIGFAAGMIHLFVHGWPGAFAFVPFAIFTRLIQVNCDTDGWGSGVARAFLMHSAGNATLFSIAQAC
jgi:hypothetical protein